MTRTGEVIAMPQPEGVLRLVLASGSASRRQILTSAGLAFDVVPATIDERAIATQIRFTGAHGPPPTGYAEDVALKLAEAKALDVAARHPQALVVGADQTLAILSEDDTRQARELHKPATMAAARAQLAELRGRTHVLSSAVALAEGGEIVWSCIDQAALTMREFSEAFLDDYLARAGEKVCSSVGAYQLEGLGIQLFEEIEGDYFTILGLPLLPLLDELRDRGVLPA